MVAKAGSHLLAAMALALLAGASAARAQDSTCLASPNGPAPAGTHWYYKTDQATHQKCWYTRAQDQAQAAPAQAAPPQAAPEQGDAANPDSTPSSEQPAAPVAVAPTAIPRVPERPAAVAAPRRAATPIARVPMPTADPRGEQQPTTTAMTDPPALAGMPSPAAAPSTPDNVAWPTPPAMPQLAGSSSPFPPPSADTQAGASDPAATAQAPTSAASPATDSPSAAAVAPPGASDPPTASPADKPAGDSGAGKPDVDTAAAAKPPGRVSVLLVVAGLIVLLIAGILLRRVVEHVLGRRRVIKLARQEPRLMEPVAVPPPMPTLLRHAPSVVPAPAQTAQRASEVEDALRQLAQSMRQRRPAANGAANGVVGRAAIRS